MTSVTWNTVLRSYAAGDRLLFDEAFLARHGGRAWAPVSDDRQAAARLHTQLVSRIGTQRLPYADGVEQAALDSLYALFEQTRTIADKHPGGHHFDTLAWYVLNTHVRPFTAKWHRERVLGSLSALDATDQFRAELRALQAALIEFDRLLLHLRDDQAPPPTEETVSANDSTILEEMQAPVAYGIGEFFSGIVNAHIDEQTRQIAAINAAERQAISRRRARYGIEDRTGAAGLAISGGGIRSATFSLGVLIALAERGLLPQFDYVSTVSGGGYLGSFLSVFLQSTQTNVGLESEHLPFRRREGEAAALRHIRHHSKYLAAGSVWERVKALSAQLHGMAINGLAVLWVLLLVAFVERTFAPRVEAAWLVPVLWLPAIAAVLWLLLLRFRRTERFADDIIGWPAAAVVLLAAGVALGLLRGWFVRTTTGTNWAVLADTSTWIAVLGALPTVAPVVQTIAPRLFSRLGFVLSVVSGIATPLFLLALYFLISSRDLTGSGARYFGYFLPHGGAILFAGLLVYLLVFDVNMTSPHRYYRRKLGEAFLIQPTAAAAAGASDFQQDVSTRLSQLTSPNAPYHLINCALNVPASTNASMQGRLTDFFLFSPAFSGSPLLGYTPTIEWEQRDPHLDVGTAMAISGAAASPQMGTWTIRGGRFWLALLNIRLGYWTRQPRVRSWMPGRPGIGYLLREMFGVMHEATPFINLSDGSHIENLGVYELLRRRCKFIVAIDGEEDARMTFHGLTTLQRLAEIDLGVQIEVDLNDLRLDDRGLSRSHFRFCRIRYPQGARGSPDDFGYLLYLKLSLTGNEGEFIRRYRLDEPAFPHHSTADQFFDEAQFEAYRSLGEHVGRKLFLQAIVGGVAEEARVDLERWFQALGRSLLAPASPTR